MSDQVERWDRLSHHHPDASVIDPRDTRGYKNHYIASLRNRAITEALTTSEPTIDVPVLDFGCGTGGLSKALIENGHTVVGVDISMGLLKRTSERGLGSRAVFLRYDGCTLPLADKSTSSAVIWVVLNYILDDTDLIASLKEIHRVLRPNGRLIAIEQVRSKRTLDLSVSQCRRTRYEFAKLFERAGFSMESSTILRYGHMPTTYVVRMGWVPKRLFTLLQKAEKKLGMILGVLPWDYCDVQFVMTKK